MIEHNLTRREALMGTAAASILPSKAKAELDTSSIPWMSAIEMARLIREEAVRA
jgi:hypothetical protein